VSPVLSGDGARFETKAKFKFKFKFKTKEKEKTKKGEEITRKRT
jgi:hypothetical protein